MNFIYFQSFYHVASTHSYSKTAELLGYSQSNISYHIHKLEEQYGALLFKRKEKIVLTKAGESVLIFAQSLMEGHATLLKQLDNEQALSPLRIGTIESLSSSLLLTYLSQLRGRYPEMTFQVRVENEHTLLNLLENDQLDVLFVFDERITTNMNYTHLYAEETFELITNKENQLEQGTTYDMILTDSECSYRKAFIEQYSSTMDLSVVLELANPADIKKLLLTGNDVAFLPKYATTDLSPERFTRLPLPLDKPFYLQWLFAEEKKNSQIQRLVSVLLEDPQYDIKKMN